MWFDSSMFYVVALLCGTWIAIARETRMAIYGYLLQTLVVAVLYLGSAIQTADIMIWLDLLGLVVLRLLVVPWVLRRFLKGDLYTGRNSTEVVSATYALVFYVCLAALGIGIGRGLESGVTGTDFGLALAVLLIGFATIVITHHTPKQILGVLGADNGADLAIVLTISRVSVVADYAIFFDVALAVLCLTLLVLRLRTYGHSHAHYFTDLRG